MSAKKIYDSMELQAGAMIAGDRVSAVLMFNGGGAALSAGAQCDIGPFPYDVVVEEWTLLGDQSGSAVIDIWSRAYANYPPTDTQSITASAPPTVSGAVKGQSSTLTGWTTTIPAGNTLRANLDSVATFERITLTLKLRKALP